MNQFNTLVPLLLLLTGCSTFRPVEDRSRFYILADAPCERSGTPSPTGAIAIADPEIAEYLKPKAIAIRSGSAEVKYSDQYFWAERLDVAIQQAFVRNMALTNVIFSAWRRESVALEIYVRIDRFDVDETGAAMLRAHHRIIRPETPNMQHRGISEFSRKGPPLANNPSGAVESLSLLVGDLSCELLKQCWRLQRAHDK